MARAKSSKTIDNEIINEAVTILKEQEETVSKIDKLKKQVQPYSKVHELKETLDRIIVEDADYIKRYLGSNSNIVYQKDFIIDDKSNFLYKSIYNNNSHELNFSKDKILLVINDYTLNSHNYNFILDIYHNGRLLKSSDYILDPGSNRYNFTSASKRIFINSELVSNGDFFSVVARKVKKIERFYVEFTINNPEITKYKFGMHSLGDIYGNVQNLAVFKKARSSDVYNLMTNEEFAFIIDKDNILFVLKNTVEEDTSIIIMNKQQELEERFTVATDMTLDEYLNFNPIMTWELSYSKIKVNGKNLPLPVTSSKEIECYIKGLKAIPEIDYTLESSATKGHYIQFKGVLEPGSEVIIRNKVFNEYYNIHSISKIDEKGFIPLNNFSIPLSENYIDVFDGRRRIPMFNKEFICDTILKVDNQTKFEEVEIYNEIDWNTYAMELIHKYNEVKPFLTKISDLNNNYVINAYEKTVEKVDTNNNANANVYTQKEIFLGIVDKIVIRTNKTVIIEGHPFEHQVIGYFDDNPIGIDITDQCVLSGFDPFTLGEQTVTATYLANTLAISDSIKVEVINKELIDLKIECPSSFFVVGDKIKEHIQVLARFEDFSEKYVTEQCIIDAPEEATEEGQVNVIAKFTYNGEVMTAEKVCVVSNTYEKSIVNYEVILNKYIATEDEYLSMQIVATYSNDLKQLIDPEYLKVYRIIDEKNKVELDMSNFKVILNQPTIIEINQYSKLGKFDDDLIDVPSLIKTKEIEVLNGTLESQNKIVVFDGSILYLHQNYKVPENSVYYRVRDVIGNFYLTIGKNPVESNSIYFGNIEDESLVIVDFLNSDLDIIESEIFKARNLDLLLDLASGVLSGNAMEGYTFSIGKLALGKTLEELKTESIRFYDIYNKQYITSLNLANGVDSITEDDDKFYFSFNDFSTDQGNVLPIRDMLIERPLTNLELKISNTNVIIKFRVNTIIYNLADLESMYLMDEPENDYLVVRPLMFKPINVYKAYHVNPKNKAIETFDYEAVGLKFIINENKSILLSEKQYGKHVYYLESHPDEATTKLYYIEIEIGFSNDITRILKVNNMEIPYEEYADLPLFDF